ncbi:SIR2 family protein [Candidatus Methylospira mobilis]|uniref:SIR2 family protein n=1 Tax=Candidatus Methylospira mobilis TaxID=1808979 RepID=A0A5Q0BEB1_9GAMM|nr:SIR2 family protein [Candidatus Methylospira mobilis]QFY41472.1 SIR2 family protein [Candidatus Methylospira mobilis]
MSQYQHIFEGLRANRIVPYIGPGAVSDARSALTGTAMPADSNSLILAMNDGKPMAPKLMYEFPRAAMNLELKRGRSFVEGFLTRTYANTKWTRARFHDWLAELAPHYVIDINRDSQLQDSYKNTPHLLIRGIARVAGTAYRFTVHQYDGSAYHEVTQEEADSDLPILFKPMGSPIPKPCFIASDADYVDYITELMGGFAIPSFLKEYRQGLQYLLMGMPLNRDSERMVMSDITWGAAEQRGWVLNSNPTDKEKRYCERIGLEIIPVEITGFLNEFQHPAQVESVAA